MTNKHCLVYETLGKVSDLKVVEGAGDGLMRLEGIFGVCGVKNQNNRVYDKENYRQMVESLQQVIKTTGCPGELEHPNSMNINLENVSHKIESIQMNEDGTITGTIVLLNTPKGQIAQAIVEGGLPLYISSRGAGTITNEGRVTLSTIKTYDLVGTPGFSQAKLTLKANQTLECLNESVEDGNVMYAIVEGDDLLGGDDDEDKDKKDKKDKKKKDDEGSDDLLSGDDDKKGDESDKKDDESDNKKDDESDKKDDEKKEEKSDDSKNEETKENKDNKNTDKVNMKDLKEAIDKLTDKVTSLEAELHVAQESLEETQQQIPTVNYDAIQQWVSEEFAAHFKDEVLTEMHKTIDDVTESMEETVDNKVNEAVNAIAEGVQSWVTEEFAPEVQNWVCEEFAPEVQNWVCEEFAPEVQDWITEEFAPEVQNWITEEFAPVVDSWINEEFAPSHAEEIEKKVNENVSAYLAENKAGRLEEIDSLLETISDNSNKELENIVKENANDNKFKGVYVVENMPAEYQPSWEMLSEARQQEIIRSSRMYDFTKEGVLESFWSNVKFDQTQSISESKQEIQSPVNDYASRIVNQLRHLRNANL